MSRTDIIEGEEEEGEEQSVVLAMCDCLLSLSHFPLLKIYTIPTSTGG